jgi:hypothetical protein
MKNQVQFNCCFCHKVVSSDDLDSYILQVRKTDPPHPSNCGVMASACENLFLSWPKRHWQGERPTRSIGVTSPYHPLTLKTGGFEWNRLWVSIEGTGGEKVLDLPAVRPDFSDTDSCPPV